VGRQPARTVKYASAGRVRSAQEEVMKNLSAFVVVAFSIALPAAFLAQLAAL
jgi:hypothetical protein